MERLQILEEIEDGTPVSFMVFLYSKCKNLGYFALEQLLKVLYEDQNLFNLECPNLF